MQRASVIKNRKADPRSWTRLGLRTTLVVVLALTVVANPLPVARTLAGHGPGLTSALLRCEPMVAAGPPGQPQTMNLYVEGVTDLYGVDLRLSFNPAIAQVVDADPGTPGVQIQPLGGFLSPDFVVRRNADNNAGTIAYAVTQLFPQAPVSGSGPLAAITFQPVANGTFSMPFSSALLVDIDGEPIPTSILPCAVQFQPLRPCFDFDNNGIVDVIDIMAVAVRWPLTASNSDPDGTPATPNYEPLYDADGDRAITIMDIQLVAERWLQTCG